MHGAWLVRRRRWVVKQQERVQETVDGSMGSWTRGLYQPRGAGAGWAVVRKTTLARSHHAAQRCLPANHRPWQIAALAISGSGTPSTAPTFVKYPPSRPCSSQPPVTSISERRLLSVESRAQVLGLGPCIRQLDQPRTWSPRQAACAVPSQLSHDATSDTVSR